MHKNLFVKIGKFAELEPGQKVQIQFMRTGKRNHPKYGAFEVTPERMQEVVNNFNENKRGIEIAIDENHDPEHIALGWVRELSLEDNGNKMFGQVELTPLGAEKLARGEYKYFSPEIVRETTDDETGEQIKNLLIGGAFTNRPYFKGMQSLKYSEDVSNDDEDTKLFLFTDANPMEKLLELLTKLLGQETMEQSDIDEAEAMYAESNGAESPEAVEMFTKFMEKKALQCGEGKPADPIEDAKPADPIADPALDPKDQKVQFTDPDTKEVMSLSFSEVKTMQDKLAEYALTEKKSNVSEKLSSVVFSEENKMGIVLPKHKDKLVDFAMGLDETQLAQFSEILSSFSTETANLFDEKGGEGDGSNLTRDEKVDAKAKEIMAEKNCEYKEAVLEANQLVDVE